MAQKNKPKQGKRVPAYSADSMAACLIVGLILIALGVLIFLAAALNLSGEVFHILRTLSRGLAGTLAVALPVIPIWGGVLVIMATKRKPPLWEFLFGCLLMLLACTTVTLLTVMSSRASLMDAIHSEVLRDGVGDGITSFLADAYEYGSGARRYDGLSIGGGFLGMLLAWPLWKGFGYVGGAVIAIVLAIAAFLLMIRLDFKGIASRIKTGADQRRTLREQQQAQQRQQELLWQQEQAARQEQMRQEQLRQQQLARQRAQQQSMPAPQPAPIPQPVPQPVQQPIPADPPDPWQNMMPAGASNWNQGQAAQPPLVQRVDPQPKKRSKKAAPQIGFQPTPEEQGQYAPAQTLPDAPEEGRKGLFRRNRSADPAEAPRRRGLFNRTVDEEETLPGEAPAPVQQQATPAPAATPAYTAPMPVVNPQPDANPAYTAPVPVVNPQPDANPAYTAPTPVVSPQPAPEAPARRRVGSRSPAQPEIPAPQETAPQAAKPVREGSFMARLQAAQAAAGQPVMGQSAAEPAVEPAQPATGRRARKDTPSAWSQPEPAGNTAWRTGDDPQGNRASGRNRAQTPPKQQPAASWADTPPWEDAPDAPITPAAPTAPVTPVLTREAPQGMWQPELTLQPRRQNMAEMPDGAMMETQAEVPYVFPPMDLLKSPEPQAGISPEEDELRSRRLENTLQSFRVPAKVRHITHGPAISRFELELAAGIKVSKVTDLNRNIAMNMEVKSVRIEAPIPGKSLVGVEVPNRERATVTLREVLESEPMRKASKPLIVALGKDIAGTPIICDLAKMPHLLIAGATGSGKSVCINTIINSLLYRCSPKEVRLILVDPKVVELQCYNGIPHLLVPVVSDPHKASGALAWAVGEMMDRYRRFQEAGVRAIDGYNENLPEGEEHMPRIVIVIDELADLMMTCKKDVEERICRLAQLARAAGIHLIVATQRPSVDVITGLIKANIPSRIAFKVSSNVDSRTILDRIGAEQLLGYGDMLYMPTGEFTPIRVQGCFLSDPEVNRITDYIRQTCPADYDPRVLEELEKLQQDADAINVPDASASEEYTGGDGNLLQQCIEMAVNDGQVSTSLIQRRLKLGYARAGRLVDEMEKRGIVSQKDGAKPRMCLISREEFEMMKDSGQFD